MKHSGFQSSKHRFRRVAGEVVAGGRRWLGFAALVALAQGCTGNACESHSASLRTGTLTAVWAQEGGDKVVQGELRASEDPGDVHNRVWDGERVRLFGARNEVVNFALVLEAADGAAEDVRVSFDRLEGPGDAVIRSEPAARDELFDWTERPIELFYVRYLKIEGLSRLTWGNYDERHVPERFRRPFGRKGRASGAWKDRPHHDASYPDIAVPLELEQPFGIASGQSQMIWADVTIPKDASPGTYRGEIIVRVGEEVRKIPVELTVHPFTLPDEPAAKTLAYVGYGSINARYVGESHPEAGAKSRAAEAVWKRHHQVARRHGVTLFDSNDGPGSAPIGQPRPRWRPVLDGSLFTAEHGYAGPGDGVGQDLFVIGAYGKWGWKDEGEAGMRRHTDVWAHWFEEHHPDAEVLLYLIDESDEYPKIERWAGWMDDNPGPGKAIDSFATLDLPTALEKTPSLDVVGSTLKVAPEERWERAVKKVASDPERRLYLYNGGRPASGSFAIEDDGVALRQIAWAQHKKGVDRWFYWHTTYYDNYQGGTGKTNVFRRAHTFGGRDGRHDAYGETGWNYTNGDGVLFYPGTDKVYSKESYGVAGPIASLRLKYWRRGIQDAAYLALAAKVDPERTAAVVQRMVPKVLWEYGVDDADDPTWKHTDVSWSNDPGDWEKARAELVDVILSGRDEGGR